MRDGMRDVATPTKKFINRSAVGSRNNADFQSTPDLVTDSYILIRGLSLFYVATCFSWDLVYFS